jgi:hypothetical protein
MTNFAVAESDDNGREQGSEDRAEDEGKGGKGANGKRAKARPGK